MNMYRSVQSVAYRRNISASCCCCVVVDEVRPSARLLRLYSHCRPKLGYVSTSKLHVDITRNGKV